MDEVEYLRSLWFTWTKIAQIVGISRRTLYRRLSEWNLPLDTYYSTISDSDLDSLVAQVKSENHTCAMSEASMMYTCLLECCLDVVLYRIWNI